MKPPSQSNEVAPYQVGYRRPPFSVDWWQYVDIDHSAQGKSA